MSNWKAETLTFASTLLATLIGVMLAFMLSNMGILKKEKADTVKLLNTAHNIIEETFDYTGGLDVYVTELARDTANERKLEAVKENNPIPYPDLLETVISTELISKNISEYTHNELYSGLINLRKVANYNSIGVYKRLLREFSLLLELEIAYQKGEIDPENIEANFESGKDELDELYPIEDATTIKLERDPDE